MKAAAPVSCYSGKRASLDCPAPCRPARRRFYQRSPASCVLGSRAARRLSGAASATAGPRRFTMRPSSGNVTHISHLTRAYRCPIRIVTQMSQGSGWCDAHQSTGTFPPSRRCWSGQASQPNACSHLRPRRRSYEGPRRPHRGHRTLAASMDENTSASAFDGRPVFTCRASCEAAPSHRPALTSPSMAGLLARPARNVHRWKTSEGRARSSTWLGAVG